MANSHRKYTGTDYTWTVALLVVAFAFCPVVLLVTRPFEDDSISLAIAFSVACGALAHMKWKHSSELTISSLVNQLRKAR